MLLVDSPRWPAHGTLYGHLVSDSSLWELHDFARTIGPDPRGFDHDHYDLAAERLPAALAAGAVQLPERELVQRLRASGLRILPAEHAPRRGRAVEMIRDTFAGLLTTPALDEVLAAYQAPSRRYHDVRHVAEMLRAQTLLAQAAGMAAPEPAEQLATLFHDVVYDGSPGDDERASAEQARRMLTEAGHPVALAEEVHRLVLLTIEHHAPDDDPAGQRLCDADLAILASAPGRYHVSVRDIRLEYGRFDDADWATGRRTVLQGFLAAERLFTTDEGSRRWEAPARRNIADELAHLLAPE